MNKYLCHSVNISPQELRGFKLNFVWKIEGYGHYINLKSSSYCIRIFLRDGLRVLQLIVVIVYAFRSSGLPINAFFYLEAAPAGCVACDSCRTIEHRSETESTDHRVQSIEHRACSIELRAKLMYCGVQGIAWITIIITIEVSTVEIGPQTR